MNLLNNVEFYTNSQEVVQRVYQVLNTADVCPIFYDSDEKNKEKPIKALILDVEMPIKNGIDTINVTQ